MQQKETQPQYSSPRPSRGSTAEYSQQHSEQFHVPAFFENPDLAEPLNAILAPESVPYFAQNGYKIAQRKPRLIDTNFPAFVTAKNLGTFPCTPVLKQTHAVSCDICLNEAIDADRMDSQGMSPQEFREVIIQEYKSRGHNHS